MEWVRPCVTMMLCVGACWYTCVVKPGEGMTILVGHPSPLEPVTARTKDASLSRFDFCLKEYMRAGWMRFGKDMERRKTQFLLQYSTSTLWACRSDVQFS